MREAMSLGLARAVIACRPDRMPACGGMDDARVASLARAQAEATRAPAATIRARSRWWHPAASGFHVVEIAAAAGNRCCWMRATAAHAPMWRTHRRRW